MQVADHRVVGDAHDRRVGVRVDRQDPLGRLAADDVLDRAADPARDVEVGRDPQRRSGRSGRCAAASRRSSRRAIRPPRRPAGRRAPRASRTPRRCRRRAHRRSTTLRVGQRDRAGLAAPRAGRPGRRGPPRDRRLERRIRRAAAPSRRRRSVRRHDVRRDGEQVDVARRARRPRAGCRPSAGGSAATGRRRVTVDDVGGHRPAACAPRRARGPRCRGRCRRR